MFSLSLKSRFILAACFIVAILPAVSFADVYQEVVPKILEATQIDSFHKEQIDKLEEQASKRIELRNVDKKQSDILKQKVLNKITELDQAYGWAVIEPEFTKKYKELFTEEEIKQIGEFIDSSAGKAFIAKTPMITQELLNKTMGQLQKITEETHQYIDQETSGIALKKAK